MKEGLSVTSGNSALPKMEGSIQYDILLLNYESVKDETTMILIVRRNEDSEKKKKKIRVPDGTRIFFRVFISP